MSGPRVVRRHRMLVALPLVATTVAILLTVSGAGDRLSEILWVEIGGMIAYTTVGAMIEDRRPGQIVGRICLTIGVLFVVSGLLVLAATTLDSLPGQLPPLGAALAVISSAIFTLVFLLSGPLLISRFPDGREPGRSAILVSGLLAVAGAIMLTGALFRPGPIEYGWIEQVDNPLGVAWIPIRYDDDVNKVAFFAYCLASILACVELIRRYIRGSSVVRAQIRWFGAAIGISIVLLALTLLIDDRLWRAGMLSLLLPPLAIGVAILRYHLYEIDRIISRTIGYGLVSVVLFGIFTAANLTFVALMSPLVNNEGIAVAASTLLAAALFAPVRQRVQRIVDRRFDRARYDGERTASAFSVRMREATDLPTVTHDLDVTVRRAIAPSHLGVWLRGGGR